MNEKLMLKTEMERKLIDMRPAKKQFPERNLHYMSNVSPQIHAQTKRLSPPPGSIPKEVDFSVQKELDNLKRILQTRNLEIARLRKEIQSYREKPNVSPPKKSFTPLIKSKTPNKLPKHDASSIVKNAQSFYGDEGSAIKKPPATWKSQVYITKRSPKPLADDPITGLPRINASSGLHQKTVRPNF